MCAGRAVCSLVCTAQVCSLPLQQGLCQTGAHVQAAMLAQLLKATPSVINGGVGCCNSTATAAAVGLTMRSAASWRFLRMSGLGTSIQGTATKEMSSRNTWQGRVERGRSAGRGGPVSDVQTKSGLLSGCHVRLFRRLPGTAACPANLEMAITAHTPHTVPTHMAGCRHKSKPPGCSHVSSAQLGTTK